MVWKTKKWLLTVFKWRIINRFYGYIEPGYLESCRGENTLTRKEKRKEKTQTLRNDTFLLHSFIKASFLSITREEREREIKRRRQSTFLLLFPRSREGDYWVPLFSPVSTLIPQKIRSFLASFPEIILGLRLWLRWIKGFSSKTHFGFDRG